jgi:hypothetical protein
MDCNEKGHDAACRLPLLWLNSNLSSESAYLNHENLYTLKMLGEYLQRIKGLQIPAKAFYLMCCLLDGLVVENS